MSDITVTSPPREREPSGTVGFSQTLCRHSLGRWARNKQCPVLSRKMTTCWVCLSRRGGVPRMQKLRFLFWEPRVMKGSHGTRWNLEQVTKQPDCMLCLLLEWVSVSFLPSKVIQLHFPSPLPSYHHLWNSYERRSCCKVVNALDWESGCLEFKSQSWVTRSDPNFSGEHPNQDFFFLSIRSDGLVSGVVKLAEFFDKGKI